MNKTLLGFIVGGVAGFVVSALFFHTLPFQSTPVRESFTFTYLQDRLDGLENKLNQAREEAGNRSASLQGILEQAGTSVWKMKHFDLPLTMVRQLIAEANQLYFLKQSDASRSKLQNARQILLQMATVDAVGVIKSAEELVFLIDDILMHMKNNSKITSEAFSSAARRVNLLLIRGDLILSATEPNLIP